MSDDRTPEQIERDVAAVAEELREDEYARLSDVLQRGGSLDANRLVKAAAVISPETLIHQGGPATGLVLEDEDGEAIAAIHCDAAYWASLAVWLIGRAGVEFQAVKRQWMETHAAEDDADGKWDRWIRRESSWGSVAEALVELIDMVGLKRDLLEQAVTVARTETHLTASQHMAELKREAAREHAAKTLRLAKCAVSDRDSAHHQELEELRPWLTELKALAADAPDS